MSSISDAAKWAKEAIEAYCDRRYFDADKFINRFRHFAPLSLVKGRFIPLFQKCRTATHPKDEVIRARYVCDNFVKEVAKDIYLYITNSNLPNWEKLEVAKIPKETIEFFQVVCAERRNGYEKTDM